jgi:hypothetical protein
MKIVRNIPVLLMVLAVLLVFGCKKKKDAEPDPEAEAIAKLVSGAWIATAVTLDTEDRTADFANFSLTITENKTYSTSGVDPIYSSVWPSSGNWDFKSSGSAIPDLTIIIRDGSLEMDIDVLSETQFILSFTFVTGSMEGTSGTEGSYIFSMAHN